MRTLSSSDSDLLPSGQIRFFQAFEPPLPAGNYQLVATQTVNIPNAATQPEPYTATQPFSVYGPRFSLLPTDLQMVFPPANQQGSFDESLPHVVLSARDLPWSRVIDPVSPSTPPPYTPWLAVLTVYAKSEMSGATPLVTLPTQMTVSDVISGQNPNGATVGPLLGTLTQSELSTNTLAFDVDAGLFAAIAPSQADLPYLSHAREVDTAAKETSGGVQAGAYSLVIGNRLPDASPTENRDSYAFLVSLEGHWDHLPGGAGTGSAKYVRLIVLVSWKFTCTQDDGDFLAIMNALPSRGGVGLLTLPYDAQGAETTPEQQYAREALDIGYAARLDNMLAGEQATSWFRGPFTPYPTVVDPNGPYATSDAATRYDPARGLFDRSYATAWQIGRLLALADGGFTRALVGWRRQLFLWQQQQQNDAALAQGLELPAPTAADYATRTERHHALLLRALRSRLGPAAKGAVTLPAVTSRRQRLDPARLPGLASRQVLDAARRDGVDPLHAILADRLPSKP